MMRLRPAAPWQPYRAPPVVTKYETEDLELSERVSVALLEDLFHHRQSNADSERQQSLLGGGGEITEEEVIALVGAPRPARRGQGRLPPRSREAAGAYPKWHRRPNSYSPSLWMMVTARPCRSAMAIRPRKENTLTGPVAKHIWPKLAVTVRDSPQRRA